MPKINEAAAQKRKTFLYHKRVDGHVIRHLKICKFQYESLKCWKESESSFNHKKVISTAINTISFMIKATYSISVERRDGLKPVLN